MKDFIQAFRREAKRQENFTNAFWRQLAVIIISIIIIQFVGPIILFWGSRGLL
jgi:hypothetical protein